MHGWAADYYFALAACSDVWQSQGLYYSC